MHGGWNNDDNQNNNLGRFRFVGDRRAPGRRLPTRSRSALRDILHVAARTSAPRPRIAPCSAYWRTTVPEWKRSQRRIEALWKQHPDGHAQLTLMAREQAPHDLHPEAGRFPQAGRRSSPACPPF